MLAAAAAFAVVGASQAPTKPATPPPPANAQDPQPTPTPPPPQEQQPEGRLPEVLVTESPEADAARLETVPLDSMGGRDRIGPKTLQKSSAMNVQEAMRRSPGVFLQEETGSDSLPNISMRGVTNGADGAWRSISLGMYADGIPLAPAPYGAPGNSLFPLTSERIYAIDLIRGGGAVRYGPNNVAGVVNFMTRPIPDEPTLVTRVRYDTFDNKSYYTAAGGTAGNFGVLVEGVYKDGQSFRSGGDYVIENYAVKTRYALSDKVRLFGQIETFDDETHLSDGLTLIAYQNDPSQTLSPRNRFQGTQDRVNLKLEWDVDDDTQFELITYWYDGNRTFFLGSPTFYGNTPPTFIQATPRPMRTFAVQPQVTKTWSLGGGATNELHVGMRYLQEDIVRNVTRYPAAGGSQLRSEEQYDYYTGSLWVENAVRWDGWSVTPGVRFEYVEVDARSRFNLNPALIGVQVEKDFTEALPSLYVGKQLAEHWAVFAGAQSTFAAPQAPQISITTNPQEVGAQYAWNYEVGTRANTENELFGFDLTLFQIEYSDRLVQDPAQFDVFVNAGSSRHRGVELGLDSNLEALGLKGVTLWGSGAYNDSRFTNGAFDGNRFPGAPEWLFAWGGRYEHELTGLWIGLDGAYVGPAYTDAANTVAIDPNGTLGLRPSYAIWNASVGWEHAIDAKNEVSVLVGGRNVFDEEYFEPRSGRGIFPGAPASMVFQVGMTHRF